MSEGPLEIMSFIYVEFLYRLSRLPSRS